MEDMLLHMAKDINGIVSSFTTRSHKRVNLQVTSTIAKSGVFQQIAKSGDSVHSVAQPPVLKSVRISCNFLFIHTFTFFGTIPSFLATCALICILA
jgi:hypothetical protein